MRKTNYLLVTIFIFLFSFTISAQTETTEDDKLSLDSGTLESQFEYLTKKSNNWRDQRGHSFEVIRNEWIAKLKSHTLDSLKVLRKELLDTQNKVTSQSQEVEQLKSSLSNTKTNLEQTNQEKDSMSLFGLQMSKGGYNTLLWSIIGGLLAFLFFFIYRFKNSNAITKEARLRLNETEEEFEEHRRNALEREQKVRRQLQDELNKNRNS
ncbi:MULTISPECIES: tRNA (guanine-N1)-methyltransferase [unclassified Olleya]|uniref:tRNA (guanine-N1)-methyltransferase n=1 Tax=unclassified Olleya TaxID=2615019 RepID=UPI000C304A96|nr:MULTISPECIES: tRNA (guanine-N1)-methyltransferase [unclassified Olleya]AUC77809.1 tRNA (guanine-N1)-methyltransferase [Olleya sp. Bg11-27]QXP58207.1 tRNA (guanine-N1)-methyltransferase [Olleya sp. HaHaR_3_96]